METSRQIFIVFLITMKTNRQIGVQENKFILKFNKQKFPSIS